MVHLDLFSGIGGFAYAADQVWDNVEHIFCDNDKFCREIIKKHWPESEVYSDIRSITTPIRADVLTGGFPCQPFSQVGSRKGTADDRYLWPEMLRVIRLTQPRWVIAENVNGLLTMQDGVVFEQVCLDLEASGYEVQPFIIPAAGVGASHKRDRVWVCAHSNRAEYRDQKHRGTDNQTDSLPGAEREAVRSGELSRTSESEDWLKSAAELCGMDDGLPVLLDGLELSKPGHFNHQIKAYGNAIVPQVAMEIMKGMAV